MPAVRRLVCFGLFTAMAAAPVLAVPALTGSARAADPTVSPDTPWNTTLRMTVEKPRFTCAGHGVAMSHVVFSADGAPGGAAALPCCDGQLGCAQFLSTTTILHGAHPWHS